MTKEYTGPEFEIEFARAWYEYVKGGKVGVDPRTNYQSWNRYDTWRNESGMPKLVSDPDFAYRWKPAPKRMVTISYKTDKMALPVARTLVAPEVEAPANGHDVYTLYSDGSVGRVEWFTGEMSRVARLKAGNIFLTQEDAQAMADWLATCRKGGQS